jgi:flagellar protein FlaJ
MKGKRTLEEIKSFYNRFTAKLRLLFTKMLKLGMEAPEEKHKMTIQNLQSITYRLIGDKIGPLLPLFNDLDPNLQKSGLKVHIRAYVSLTIFAAILISIAILAVTPCMLFFAFHLPLLPALLFGVGGSLLSLALSIIGFYAYPIYRSDALKRKLEDELPFTTGYMAILASAGVSPEKIFHSISGLSVPLTASAEARDIVRDVNLFGSDIISALVEASKRTPSEIFREMIEGFISTIHSGSNLAAYLREKSGQYMKLKRISLKKFSDTLSILSEFYVTILLTGPLMFVIMLSVMTMLGGGDLGTLSPDFLLRLLTYMAIPLGAAMFLIVVDAISPKW